MNAVVIFERLMYLTWHGYALRAASSNCTYMDDMIYQMC